jgi:large subunit ribosomal protein L21
MPVIIQMGTTQLTVSEGDTVKVPLLKEEVGATVAIDKVLAVIEGEKSTFGAPFVEGAKVEATVLGHGKEKKIVVFHYASKKRRRVKTGHRQNFTSLKIDKIVSA